MSEVRKEGSSMTQKQRALLRDITYLLDSSYTGVAYDEVVEVFAHALQQQLKKEGEEPLSNWRSPDGQRYYFGERGGGLVLAIEPQHAEAFDKIHHDIESNGALMVDLPTPAPLNSHLNVCVLLSPVDLEIWYRARVVHISPEGVALTLEVTSDEHQVWWAVAKRAYSRGGVAVTVPRTGPNSSPPTKVPKARAEPGITTKSRSLESTGVRAIRKRPALRSRRVPARSSSLGGKTTKTTKNTKNTKTAETAPESTDAASMIKVLVDKRSKLVGADHFDVLGLHWSAYSDLVNQAYERDMSRFKVENFDGVSRDRLTPELEAIQAAIESSYRELKCEHKRRLYRVAHVNAYQIQSAVELYLDKGRTALMRDDPRQAAECFKRVLELDPSNQKAKSRLTECMYRGA
jgi:hypothetical protein